MVGADTDRGLSARSDWGCRDRRQVEEMSADPRPRDYAKHEGLILDALESMWERVPQRRGEIVECFKDFHLWHNHDQEDDEAHCDPKCPAWFRGAFCSACGKQHRKVVANGDAK